MPGLASPPGHDMNSRLTSVMQPGSIAVIGASTQRHTLGNQVLRNLDQEDYRGSVVAVHPRASSVEGRPAVRSVADLPSGTDVAMVCLPAASVLAVLTELDQAGVRAAVVPTAGFTTAQYQALHDGCSRLDLLPTGPNCLGILSLADRAALWTAGYRNPLPLGSVGLVAQSGSAAISIMSSPGVSCSRIISSGSELAVTSADYIRWLASDDATSCIGLVLESIRAPRDFAAAVAAAHAAGKPVVALKVGRSALGLRAAQAHTGALVTDYDAYTAFFRRIGVPTVLDYDEMVGTLQCLAVPKMPASQGPRVAVVGISGGQTALACDVAAEAGVQLAAFSEQTVREVEAALPGGTGSNPVDIGSSIRQDQRRPDEVLRAVLADPGVDSLLVIQDAQSTIPLQEGHMYLTQVGYVEQASRTAAKPIVLASSSAADTHPMLEEIVAGSAVPFLRGLRPALVALRNLSVRPAAPGQPPESAGAAKSAGRDELRRLAAGHAGPLPHQLTQRLLAAYGVPAARSALAGDEAQALAAAGQIGYPLVVKVASRDVPHRLEAGGVVVGVHDAGMLAAALDSIGVSVRQAVPGARIDGYELQEYVPDAIEAVIGFRTAPPFGAVMMAGAGGSMVELIRDSGTDLAPLSVAQAAGLIRSTRLGQILAGYRNIVPVTSIDGLADALHRLSLLAADLDGLITEADLNPALIEARSGKVRVVDALLIGAGPS